MSCVEDVKQIGWAMVGFGEGRGQCLCSTLIYGGGMKSVIASTRFRQGGDISLAAEREIPIRVRWKTRF